ncbi:MAG: hypothetical protein MRZ79_01895 [Bacteroidia bacterium]|nr:hypothetical protein [Bacteroidia bacterium]
MKTYLLEHQPVELAPLKAGLMPRNTYVEAHQKLVIACHDIMVYLEDQQAWLLILRKNEPARDILWPLGGRILRGMNTIDSAIKKVKEESKLDITEIREVGYARTFFQTDPFGHGKGTDTLNVLLIARAKGEVSLDELHEEPTFIKKEDYTPDFIKSLHPYVADFFELAWAYLENDS